MAHRGERLYVCPECGKRGVSVRQASDDFWACRYCQDFSAYTSGEDGMDVSARRRLAEANPDREVWISGSRDVENE